MSEIAPGFLVAVPQPGDPNFHRAVVLMLEHSDKGAMGLVVNRPAPLKLAEVAEGQGIEVGAGYKDAPVFVGGPVEPERGFVLHAQTEVAEAIPFAESESSIRTMFVMSSGAPARCGTSSR